MLKNARKPHKENNKEILLVEPLYTKQPRKFYNVTVRKPAVFRP